MVVRIFANFLSVAPTRPMRWLVGLLLAPILSLAPEPGQGQEATVRAEADQYLVGEPITIYYDLGDHSGRRNWIGIAVAGSDQVSSSIRPILLGPDPAGTVELEGLEEGSYDILLNGQQRGDILARAPLRVVVQLVMSERVEDLCTFPGNTEPRLNADLASVLESIEADIRRGDITAARDSLTRLICDGASSISNIAGRVHSLTADDLDEADHGRTTQGPAALREHLDGAILPAFSELEHRITYLNASLVAGDNPVLRCLAARLLMASAVQGYEASQWLMARATAHGSACAWEPAPEEAVVWYERGTAQGSPRASAYLGLAYLLGEGVRSDSEEGIRLLTAAAEAPNVEAQFLLGTVYDQGLGVQPDEVRALEWLERAAENGHPVANMVLGEKDWAAADALFSEVLATDVAGNRRVEDLYEQAISRFERAAGLGYAAAQYRLGVAHRAYQRTGLAEEWFERAARQGHSGAQAALGILLARRDEHQEALIWMTRAAEAGYARAQTYLGRAYLVGTNGAPLDEALGIEWLRAAADQRDAGAEETLAWAYMNGRGVKRNDRRAAYWNNRAAEHGSQLAATRTWEGTFRRFATRVLGGADIYHLFVMDIGRGDGTPYEGVPCQTVIGFSCNPGIDQWAAFQLAR